MTASMSARASKRALSSILVATFAGILLLLFAGCADKTAPPAGMVTTSVSVAGATPSYSPVTFTTDDGLALSGRIFGQGGKGVVLAHMYPADQNSWEPVAQRLAGEGFLVLTFDFRGYGDSEGGRDIQYLDRDVTAAISAIRQAGAQQAVLVGASMGGTACLKAADQAQALSSIRLAGVATLSAPVEFRGLSAQEAVPRLQIPLLFIAAENDSGASGARTLQELAGGRGTLVILPGSDHGTDLFVGAQAEETWTRLSLFIKDCMPN